MTILITGATGFVGRHMVATIDDFFPVVRQGEANSFENSFVVSTIDGKTDWNGAFNAVDSIIHLAGIAHTHDVSPRSYKAVNVDGTLHLAREAARCGVRRLVFVSSIGVNGINTFDGHSFTADSPAFPHNSYAESKYLAERGLLEISKSTGLEVVIVRPTLVYGTGAPGNFGSLVGLVRRLPSLPFGMVDNKRDFISVQNLADLLVYIANSSKGSGCTFLASDCHSVSIGEFTNCIAQGLGKSVVQLKVPTFLFRIVGKLTGKSTLIEQLVGDLCVDSSNINSILGWSPPYTMAQSMENLSEIEND
ncbi:NAD-dependent epimerase/dehydratase family protein [Vibrio lentus]